MGPERDELAVEVQDFFELPKRQVGAAEVVRTLLGMAFMLAGAELLVRSAVDLAARLGLAQGFVGLTFVAVGTSSPLVAAGIQAARRGDHDLVVGNLLGGNLVIGLGGAVTLAFLRHGPSGAIELAPLLLMAAIALVSWGFMARRSVVTRWEAALLLVSYAAMLPFVTH